MKEGDTWELTWHNPDGTSTTYSGNDGDPEDEWLPIRRFHPALHDAIEKTSNCSMNFVPYFPPDRPWARGDYEQMFYYAITETENHLQLLSVADAVRRCQCIGAESRANLLLNLSRKL